MNSIHQSSAEGNSEFSITAEDVREALLLDARRFMRLALAAEVTFWVSLIVGGLDSPSVFLATGAYAGAAIATALGVFRGAKASDMRPALKALFLLLALFGIVRLIPMAAYMGRSPATPSLWQHQVQDAASAETARRRAAARQQQRARRRPELSQWDALEEGVEGLGRLSTFADVGTESVAEQAEPVEPVETLDSSVLWPAAALLRQHALARLSSAVPRIRMLDTEGHADGELLPPEFVMRDLKIPFEVDLSRLELPLTRATKGVFGVQYMLDEGNRYTAVVESDLADAGLSVDELHRMAMANLHHLVREDLRLRRANPNNPNNSALRIKLDGYHDTSTLLLDDLWDKALKKHIPNGVLAVMPSRDVCTFIDLSALTKGGLADLRETMLQAKHLHGEVVNAILHRQGRNWALAGQVDGV